jgi:stage II sporulation protein D
MKRKLILTILLTFYFFQLSSQVRVRLLTGKNPDYLFFTVTSGAYQVDNYRNEKIILNEGDVVILARNNDMIAVKTRGEPVVPADSMIFRALTGESSFSLASGLPEMTKWNYSGDLECSIDLAAILLINTCDIEKYIAGVVKAEGGNGKYEEYFKTQAVITRTYTYRNLGKHMADGYDLCDDTHCQVYEGNTSDSLIVNAVLHTRGLVITTPDSNLINSAFHSNCGGETSPSEYVWLTSLPYLKKVIDPYCTSSGNAAWEKRISLNDWISMFEESGYGNISRDITSYRFDQAERKQDYVTGTLSVPLIVIRDKLGLKSTWFSVSVSGDSLILKGRGYGHGVGLCQEGAMEMAKSGKKYKDIVAFYYNDVRIIPIHDTKKENGQLISMIDRPAK